MRWGFGMKQGPFELWQEAGWLEVAKMVQEDIDAGQGAVQRRRREMFEGPVAQAGGVHGRWIVEPGKSSARRVPPVYERQHFPEALLGEASRCPTGRRPAPPVSNPRRCAPGRLMSRGLIASIKNKMHAISPEVMEGLMEAVDLAEAEYQGMVIWSGDAPFSWAPTCKPPCRPLRGRRGDAIDSIEHELQT